MISGDNQNDYIDNNGIISSLSPIEVSKRITVFRPKSDNNVDTEPNGFIAQKSSQNESRQNDTPVVESKRLFQSPIVGNASTPQTIGNVVHPESLLNDPIRYTVEVHNFAVKFLRVSFYLDIFWLTPD